MSVCGDRRTLDAARYEALIPGLAALIVDAVDGGAGVNFLAGVTIDEAAAWWRERLPDVARRDHTAFVADEDDGTDRRVDDREPFTQHQLAPSRLDRQGPRPQLGAAARHGPRAHDGGGGARPGRRPVAARPGHRHRQHADRLYRALGWTGLGAVPDYGLLPDGTPSAATFFWKDLR